MKKKLIRQWIDGLLKKNFLYESYKFLSKKAVSIELLNEAVAMVDGRIITEASGGITPTNITDVAASGVDLISLGWLTHSIDNWDVGLDFEPTYYHRDCCTQL